LDEIHDPLPDPASGRGYDRAGEHDQPDCSDDGDPLSGTVLRPCDLCPEHSSLPLESLDRK
jgi:hypothetical protein